MNHPVLEKFITEYFLNNNIPLNYGKKKVSTVLMVVYGYKKANTTDYYLSKFTKEYFKNKPKYKKILNYILDETNKKYCYNCNTLKLKEDFNKSITKSTRLESKCRNCDNLKSRDYYNINTPKIRKNQKKWKDNNKNKLRGYSTKRKAAKLNRTPKWADKEAINFFYECCPKGCHVDHIIPLQGKNISGLHVETNLQWLPAIENLRKNNKF